MISFFHEYLYIPIYNLLIYLVDVLPGADIGLAVIMVTLIVKIITLPLSISALRTQQAMRRIEPKLKELRETYKDDKQKQAEAMFALYREEKIKPFSSIIGMFVQIPILITLFLVFRHESMTQVNPDILYSFVADPGTFSALFLGFFVIAGHNIILALLAGGTQFVQAYFAIPVPKRDPEAFNTKEGMQAEFGRAMAVQARYVLPIVIGVVAFSSGAIALYFITSNVFGIVQELILKKTIKKPEVAPA